MDSLPTCVLNISLLPRAQPPHFAAPPPASVITECLPLAKHIFVRTLSVSGGSFRAVSSLDFGFSVLIGQKSLYPHPANYLVQRTWLPSSFIKGVCKTSMKISVLRVFLDFSRHEIHGCFVPLFFFFPPPGRRLLVRWLKF